MEQFAQNVDLLPQRPNLCLKHYRDWITADGAYLYQIYGNASTLVGYATRPDGSLHEITRVKIPYNSPQGLAGF